VPNHIEQAQAKIMERGQSSHVTATAGWIEAIPAPDCSFDLIWCRDILPHLSDLPRAFAECSRVLKPGGKMLIYATFVTSLLTPAEASQLYPPLAVVAQNMEPT
jgi:ubiquinone/menaquinone biosynthesis C-methylase UbiE